MLYLFLFLFNHPFVLLLKQQEILDKFNIFEKRYDKDTIKAGKLKWISWFLKAD